MVNKIGRYVQHAPITQILPRKVPTAKNYAKKISDTSVAWKHGKPFKIQKNGLITLHRKQLSFGAKLISAHAMLVNSTCS